MKDEASVLGLPKIEGGAQDQGEKVVVLVEAEEVKPSVGMLELLEGAEALNETLLHLQSLEKCRGGSVGHHGHHLFFEC